MPIAERCLVWFLLGTLCSLSGCAAGLHGRGGTIDLLPGDPILRPVSSVAPANAADDCVNAAFFACAEAWEDLRDSNVGDAEAQRLYCTAVWRLLATAGRHGRIDPLRGLTLRLNGATVNIPIEYCGFAWQPSDFQRLHQPTYGHEPLLEGRHGCSGAGCPLVVERSRRDCDPFEARFFPERSFFAATAVLEFPATVVAHDPAQLAASAELRFYDPHHVRQTSNDSLPLAADYTAPLAVTLQEAPRSYFAGFIEPGGSTTRPRLALLEPYQPGKIPVVLIHGLFSDPQSWADMINDLRATPGFADRFQLWVFRYPTGRGFMQSATALRQQLNAVVTALDPESHDPALRNIVLVGHSMGGLIAKLQVTYSDELIWNTLANRPLETINTSEQTRGFLAENCYFDPSPHVSRVVFIASPHSGSSTASGLVGRGASLLVEPAPEQQALHDQLMRDNPGTFNPLVESRLPTSIDMLSPQSPLLDVMKKMRLKPGLTLHNIIGVHSPLTLDGPSDGVVSVSSAKHPCCQSVLAFNAPHSKIHRSPKASCEVLRILNLHAANSASTISGHGPAHR